MGSLQNLYQAIGAPSWISGVLLPSAIAFLAKYTKAKLSKIEEMSDDLAVLKQKLNDMERYINTRIDDMKK